MADEEESMEARNTRFMREVQAREEQLGEPAPDGPSFEKAHVFVSQIQRLMEVPAEEYTLRDASDLWQAALEVEFAWRFPEKDPLAARSIQAAQRLRLEMQQFIVSHNPELEPHLQQLEELSLIANRAGRAARSSWFERVRFTVLMSVARLFYWIGGRKR